MSYAYSQVDLVGEWFSERCETRPNSMFVTRRVLFDSDGRTWSAYYYHYSDALCRKPHFTIFASGTYSGGSPSRVQYATEFDFTVTSATVTPDDDSITQTLNQHAGFSPDCGDATWQRGRERNITLTGGCQALGISLPSVELELVKVEKDHHMIKLYLGQRATDYTLSKPQVRPTSFQPPLVKCAQAMNFTPPVTYRKEKFSSGALRITAYLPLTMLLIIILGA